MFDKILTFIKEVRAELAKVNWPTKKQTFNYTILVVGVSIVVAIFLGGLDYFFGLLVNGFLLK